MAVKPSALLAVICVVIGNGVQIFMEHVAEQSKFTLDFSQIDRDLWNATSEASCPNLNGPIWAHCPWSTSLPSRPKNAEKNRGKKPPPPTSTYPKPAIPPHPPNHSTKFHRDKAPKHGEEPRTCPDEALGAMNAEEETESWAPQHWSRQEWFYMGTKELARHERLDSRVEMSRNGVVEVEGQTLR